MHSPRDKRKPLRSRSTEGLLLDAKIRVVLLQLFQRWSRLDAGPNVGVPALVHALDIVDVKVDIDDVTELIYKISLLEEDEVTVETLQSLTNTEFVTFMKDPKVLGSLPRQKMLAKVKRMLHFHDEAMNDTAFWNGMKSILHQSHIKPVNIEHDRKCEKIESKLTKGAPKPKCTKVVWKKLAHLGWFFGWWAAGVTFYTLSNKWSFATAIYYTIQSGFSIGFGSISEKKASGVDLFKKCAEPTEGIEEALVWLRSAVSPALSEFADAEIAEGSGKDSAYTPCVTLSRPNEYAQLSMCYTIVSVYLGATLISGVLALFTRAAIESHSSWVEEAHVQGQKKPRSWPQRFCKSRWPALRAMLLLLGWTVCGAIMFININDSTLIEGIYFAVTAASTGGLNAPRTTTLSLICTTIYCIVGVPLYAQLLGVMAEYFTSRQLQAEEILKRQEPITELEFSVIDKMGNSNGQVDRNEFSLLWLLRNGLATPKILKDIEQDFDELDGDNSGEIKISEIQVSQLFDRFSNSNRQISSYPNFVALIEMLGRVENLEFVHQPGKLKMLIDPEKKFSRLDFQRIFQKRSGPKLCPGQLDSSSTPSGNKVVPGEFSFKLVVTKQVFMEWWARESYDYRVGREIGELKRIASERLSVIQVALNRMKKVPQEKDHPQAILPRLVVVDSKNDHGSRKVNQRSASEDNDKTDRHHHKRKKSKKHHRDPRSKDRKSRKKSKKKPAS